MPWQTGPLLGGRAVFPPSQAILRGAGFLQWTCRDTDRTYERSGSILAESHGSMDEAPIPPTGYARNDQTRAKPNAASDTHPNQPTQNAALNHENP